MFLMRFIGRADRVSAQRVSFTFQPVFRILTCAVLSALLLTTQFGVQALPIHLHHKNSGQNAPAKPAGAAQPAAQSANSSATQTASPSQTMTRVKVVDETGIVV